MKLREKLELAELYHELAQNAIVEVLKYYLQNVSGLFRPFTGRPSNRSKKKVCDVADSIQVAAENIEEHLEYINSNLISELENEGSD